MTEPKKLAGTARVNWISRLEELLPPSPALAAELSALVKETDDSLFMGEISRMALRLGNSGHETEAAALFGALSDAPGVSETLRDRPRREARAISGDGTFGQRFEFLLPRVVKNAADPRVIFPAVGASLLARGLGAGLLARFFSSDPTWWTRGWAARGLAGLGSLTAESLAWTTGLRALSPHSARDFSQDLFSAVLNLSVFHGLSSAANRWAPMQGGVATPLALLGGLALVQGVERRLGGRPSSPFAVADTLATFLGLTLGSHLARGLLGGRFAAYQAELAVRAETSQPRMNFLPEERVFSGRRTHLIFSEMLEEPEPGPPASTLFPAKSLKIPREIPSSKGPSRPFFLLRDPESADLWTESGSRWMGRRLPIAEREGREIAIRIERHELNQNGDPITPEGVTKLHFSVEEGETRGKVFTYFGGRDLTLYFLDLEESMITGGPSMRPGAGSIVMTWLAEQAAMQGKNFNVTRITSAQTVRILQRQGLIDPIHSRVEACTRLNPEAYDEEYRVEKVFPFSDAAQWRQQAGNADFFSVYQTKYPEKKSLGE